MSDNSPTKEKPAMSAKQAKEAEKIKAMHDAQIRLAQAAAERERERAAKLVAELEKGDGRDAHAISREKLEDVLKEVAPKEKFDDDVKTALLHLADDFVEEVARNAQRLAKLRNSDVVDEKDVALHLEREWDIVVPGTSGEELKPYKRPQRTNEQTEREAKVRKAMARAMEARLLQEREAKREARRRAKREQGEGGEEEEEDSEDESDDDVEPSEQTAE